MWRESSPTWYLRREKKSPSPPALALSRRCSPCSSCRCRRTGWTRGYTISSPPTATSLRISTIPKGNADAMSARNPVTRPRVGRVSVTGSSTAERAPTKGTLSDTVSPPARTSTRAKNNGNEPVLRTRTTCIDLVHRVERDLEMTKVGDRQQSREDEGRKKCAEDKIQ